MVSAAGPNSGVECGIPRAESVAEHTKKKQMGHAAAATWERVSLLACEASVCETATTVVG